MRARRALAALAFALLLGVCASYDQQASYVPYRVVAGDAALPLQQAPLWRLDRLFHRTTANLTCGGSQVRRRAVPCCVARQRSHAARRAERC